MIPFTASQFLDVFAAYNTAIWPAQVFLFALGVAAVVAAARGVEWGGRLVAGTLALYWVWMGALYHLAFFRRINPAAVIFGVFFMAQGVLFFVAAVRGSLSFGAPRGWSGILGLILIAYATAGCRPQPREGVGAKSRRHRAHRLKAQGAGPSGAPARARVRGLPAAPADGFRTC